MEAIAQLLGGFICHYLSYIFLRTHHYIRKNFFLKRFSETVIQHEIDENRNKEVYGMYHYQG